MKDVISPYNLYAEEKEAYNDKINVVIKTPNKKSVIEKKFDSFLQQLELYYKQRDYKKVLSTIEQYLQYLNNDFRFYLKHPKFWIYFGNICIYKFNCLLHLNRFVEAEKYGKQVLEYREKYLREDQKNYEKDICVKQKHALALAIDELKYKKVLRKIEEKKLESKKVV